MPTDEDVLERADAFVQRIAKGTWPSDGRDASDVISTLAAEVRELRKELQHSDGMQRGALRLKRLRDLRLQAIRDAINQSKGDNLVRREVEWLLDCDWSELDGYAAMSEAKGE